MSDPVTGDDVRTIDNIGRLWTEDSSLEKENEALKSRYTDGPCHFCGLMTSARSASCMDWNIAFPHKDGKNEAHHARCLFEKLRDSDRLRAENEALRNQIQSLVDSINLEYARVKKAFDAEDWITLPCAAERLPKVGDVVCVNAFDGYGAGTWGGEVDGYSNPREKYFELQTNTTTDLYKACQILRFKIIERAKK